MLRVTANWAGPVTGVATSTFHFVGATPGGGSTEEAQGATTAVHTFLNLIRAVLAPTETIQVQQVVDIIDPATGQITGSAVGSIQAVIEGEGTGGFCRAAGAIVNWSAGIRVNGRVVRGRTFLVPLAGNAWDVDGQLSDAALTRIVPAAAAIVGIDGLVLSVFQRPRGGTPGAARAVIGSDVPVQGAILTSRRD